MRLAQTVIGTKIFSEELGFWVVVGFRQIWFEDSEGNELLTEVEAKELELQFYFQRAEEERLLAEAEAKRAEEVARKAEEERQKTEALQLQLEQLKAELETLKKAQNKKDSN